MKKKIFILALVGILAHGAFAACPQTGTTRYCEGKLEYLWVSADGKIRTNVLYGSNSLQGLILDPTFLTVRFDRIYSEMMSALYRNAGIYVEYEGATKRITTFAVYNPEFQPPQ